MCPREFEVFVSDMNKTGSVVQCACACEPPIYEITLHKMGLCRGCGMGEGKIGFVRV